MADDRDDGDVVRFSGTINEKFVDWETDVRRNLALGHASAEEEDALWTAGADRKDETLAR